MKIVRRKTKVIKIGRVRIGGNNPVAIQSMAKAATKDIEGVVKQIKKLEVVGCEIVRVAVKDEADALAIGIIKKYIDIPLVADIHFNWKFALKAIDNGADKIRLNPGNIIKKSEIKEIVEAAKQARIPIRVGLNSGSVKRANAGKKISTADLMVKSGLDYLKIIEDFGFYDIVVSLKASDILGTVEAYSKMSSFCDYPFHLGVTATGLPHQGMIKSSIAIGTLLLQGIGDTIRISLTDSPEEEIKAARSVLESLGLRNFGPQIISCPTCGRCEVDLINIVSKIEEELTNIKNCKKPIKVAIMGCVVNGPGEAREADVGIAFGKKEGLLFLKGKPVKKISPANSIEILLKEVKKLNG